MATGEANQSRQRGAKAVVLALVLLGASFPLRASGLTFAAPGLDDIPGSHSVVPDAVETPIQVLAAIPRWT